MRENVACGIINKGVTLDRLNRNKHEPDPGLRKIFEQAAKLEEQLSQKAELTSLLRAHASLRLHHVAKDVLQDAAVAVVFELVDGVDAAEQFDLLALAVVARDAAGEVGARLQA